MTITNLEDITPFKHEEITPAIERLVKHETFFNAVKFVFPDLDNIQISEIAKGVKTSYDFQKEFMCKGVRKILAKSSNGLTYSGIDNIEKDKAYLYIANHRDIFLDSSILEIILFENDMDTTQITFGSNLMSSEFLVDFGKINKMFTVNRDGDKAAIYKSSLLLSNYIRKTITKDNESVWIAQRNGRTKDGIDLTQTGLLKMLNMSGETDFTHDFKSLNIIPLTISYEYEPCDIQKAIEVCVLKTREYVKEPGEDMKSIVSGIVENKGRIHMHFDKPINSVLTKIEDEKNINNKIKFLAEEIDSKIYKGYKLWNTNFIAADILKGTDIYSDNYTPEEFQRFVNYVEAKLENLEKEYKDIRNIFLSIYANPVFNSEK